MLGLLVFTFKVVIAFVSILVCLGFYTKLTEKKPISEKCSCRGYLIRCLRVLCEQIDKRRQSVEKTRRKRSILVTAGGLRGAGFVFY